MPWVNETMCVGCGLCVDYCPVQAIRQNSGDKKAVVDDAKCIRCGKCHEVCPQDAVRHDSEKIPVLVEENMIRTKALIKHYDSAEGQEAFLERMIRHFNMQKKVAVLTIDKLNDLKQNGQYWNLIINGKTNNYYFRNIQGIVKSHEIEDNDFIGCWGEKMR